MSDIYTHAMEQFEERYSDFISLFNSKSFYAKVRDEIALTGITKPVTVDSIIRDTEQATVRLLDRGALNSIQKFGTTNEAEDQIVELQKRAGKTREPVARNTESSSRWSNLTQEQLDAMPARQSRELYKTDSDFRAAFDRLAAEDASKALSPDTTGRVFLRKSDGQFFKEWKNGIDYWTQDFDLRAHMSYSEGHRQIENFRKRGIEVESFEMGNNRPVDVSPKQQRSEALTAKPATAWRLEPSGLTTVGSRQRRHPHGTFLLKSQNGEFVLRIDDANRVVKTVSQSGNARAWTSRETAIAAAESIPGLNFWLYRHDGESASS